MSREWREEELVQVGAIEHYSYCPRQCGLIHVEATFEENLFTLRGRFAHERTDLPGTTTESGVRVERALPLWSDRYGLTGKADLVEFRCRGDPFPVEYKSGRRRKALHAFAQLCGQALCLEEMLGVQVRRGGVYYVASRQRVECDIDDELRVRTIQIIENIREMQIMHILPPPVADKRCRDCSLSDACLPELILGQTSLDDLLSPEAEGALP
jgi:CRISPR-associated exonuclease Cas4